MISSSSRLKAANRLGLLIDSLNVQSLVPLDGLQTDLRHRRVDGTANLDLMTTQRILMVTVSSDTKTPCS
jgi:hypothetical protein